jgi:hypothetical protein
VKTDDIKINRTWLHVSSSIYISFIQQENVSSLFTVYPCRVCEQTNGEQKKKNKTERKKSFGINRENVYKNEQNGTNTRIQPMRQNREK